MLAEIRPNFGASSAETGQVLPVFGLAHLTHFCRMPADVWDGTQAMSNHSGTSSTKLGLMPADFGPTSAEFGRIQHAINTCCPDADGCWPELGRGGANSPSGVALISAELGQLLAKIDKGSAKFGPPWFNPCVMSMTGLVHCRPPDCPTKRPRKSASDLEASLVLSARLRCWKSRHSFWPRPDPPVLVGTPSVGFAVGPGAEAMGHRSTPGPDRPHVGEKPGRGDYWQTMEVPRYASHRQAHPRPTL